MAKASGSIDLKATKAASTTATHYITNITSNNGIWVTPSNRKPTTSGDVVENVTTGTKIDGEGLEIYKDGICIAQYGDDAIIGQVSGVSLRTIIDSDTFYITNGTTEIVHIGNENLTIIDSFTSDEITTQFTLSDSPLNNEVIVSPSSVQVTIEGKILTVISGLPEYDESFTVSYTPSTTNQYYSFGTRNSGTVGKYSFSEGSAHTVSGNYSHAEGYFNTVSGQYSHAEGTGNRITGNHSHSEGSNNSASGQYSHAEGYNNGVSGNYSHAQGYMTKITNNYSHTQGYKTGSQGVSAHAQGYSTIADGHSSHSEGYQTHAIGQGSHSSGINTIALNPGSFSEGSNTKAIGINSHSEGRKSIAIGYSSHVEGGISNQDNFSSFQIDISSGDTTIVDRNYIISNLKEFKIDPDEEPDLFAKYIIGASALDNQLYIQDASYDSTNQQYTIKFNKSLTSSIQDLNFILPSRTVGDLSHAEGSSNSAIGNCSHVEGIGCIAQGLASHAQNFNTYAGSNYQTVIGKWNIFDKENNYAFIIGNGNSTSNSYDGYFRSNAFAVDWNGNTYCYPKRIELGRYISPGLLTSGGKLLLFSIPLGRVLPSNASINSISFRICGRAASSTSLSNTSGGYYFIRGTSDGSDTALFDSTIASSFFYDPRNNRRTITSTQLLESTSIQGGTNILISISSSTDYFFTGDATILGYLNNQPIILDLQSIVINLNYN